ncbi:MAG: PPOX class F420-dependent oxidoreductase [Deltaproteobacteria bacterium]|nr:PPOX class F420-dependent oxidoreductase [Deltaproteobacteria bacterium]
MIPESHVDILEKPSFAHIATLMPDGAPQVTPVWVDYEDGKILVNSSRGRRKDLNIERDRRVALSVLDPENPYRGLAVRGRVVEINSEDAEAHIDKMARKYLNKETYRRRADEVRVLYKILPETVHLIGG